MAAENWNTGAKTFHWLVALCIVVAAALGLLAESVSMSPGKLQLFIWHKSFGLTVLALMLLRVSWRLLSTAPAELEQLTPDQRRLAGYGHTALYMLAVLMPLSGWLLNSAANFPFRWFGLVTVPMLIAPNESVQDVASLAHYLLFLLLTLLVLGHILMAFKHQDSGVELMQRMLPGHAGPITMIGGVILAGTCWVVLAWISSYAPAAPTVRQASAPAEASLVTNASVAVSDENTVWAFRSAGSRLGFTGSYDGVDFEGRFQTFTPRIQFDPTSLESSAFDVMIDVASVTTDSVDRDEMLPTEDWFNVALFPQARYRADRFQATEEGFVALGTLELKGIVQEVPLEFTWQQSDQGALLEGSALINRRDFSIGAGFWADDPTVGFEVRVSTRVLLLPPG